MTSLEVAFEKFLEAARAAGSKRAQAPVQKKYLAAIQRRFQLQGKWFVKSILPTLCARLFESLREADKPLSAAEILEAIAKVLSELKDYEDDAALVTELDSLLALAYSTGIKSSIADLEGELSFAPVFGLESPAAVQYLRLNEFSNLAKTLDATTAEQLQGILAEGLEAGLSYSQIAKLITAKFSDFGAARARLIAITEIGNAYSDATLESGLSLQDRGIEMEKSWMTAGDDRVDEPCEANEAAGWIFIQDDFPSGSGRPLDHPGCRCALLVRRAVVEVPDPVLVA
jgi:SPP1 gp7 family putative phage head morphogenesis protein